MDFFRGFIDVLGLDGSFFFHLIWAAGLYFITAETVLKPYLRRLEKQKKLTGGRFENSRRLREETAKLKVRYEAQARKAHREFQKHFGALKRQAEEESKQRTAALQTARARNLRKEKERIAQERSEREAALKKEIPALAGKLTEKLYL